MAQVVSHPSRSEEHWGHSGEEGRIRTEPQARLAHLAEAEGCSGASGRVRGAGSGTAQGTHLDKGQHPHTEHRHGKGRAHQLGLREEHRTPPGTVLGSWRAQGGCGEEVGAGEGGWARGDPQGTVLCREACRTFCSLGQSDSKRDGEEAPTSLRRTGLGVLMGQGRGRFPTIVRKGAGAWRGAARLAWEPGGLAHSGLRTQRTGRGTRRGQTDGPRQSAS